MGSLGSSSMAKVYPPGIHVPSLTWFKDGDEQAIDWEVQEKHIRFLVDSGLHGSSLAYPLIRHQLQTNTLPSQS
jgi:hypothetical protein